MFSSVLFLIFAYILGSFPSGYLITRWSTGKNILKIGWRKTSGSNIYRHIGKWQGLLTGILDMAKGYLAVYLAQKLGFSSDVQVLSGVVAVTGHNWSCFLRFAGGRGIGTFIGAASALSPGVFWLSFISFVLFSFILNSAIATFIFLATVLFLSIHFYQLETIGLFTILCLLPILIKRLSPIEEIFPLKEKKILIKNRLIFDNDEIRPIKIKRLF